jgi:hypothetical protein
VNGGGDEELFRELPNRLAEQVSKLIGTSPDGNLQERAASLMPLLGNVIIVAVDQNDDCLQIFQRIRVASERRTWIDRGSSLIAFIRESDDSAGVLISTNIGSSFANRPVGLRVEK